MALSAFSQKTQKPSDSDLRSTLGKAYERWRQLLALIAGGIDPITQVWGFTSASTGWGLRVRHKERVLLYMTPQRDQFLVSFALGAKAIAAAHAAELPAEFLAAIDAAPQYAEGRGVRFKVTSTSQIAPLVTLAQIKDQN